MTKFISSCMIIRDSGGVERPRAQRKRKLGTHGSQKIWLCRLYDRTPTVRTDSEGKGKKNQ